MAPDILNGDSLDQAAKQKLLDKKVQEIVDEIPEFMKNPVPILKIGEVLGAAANHHRQLGEIEIADLYADVIENLSKDWIQINKGTVTAKVLQEHIVSKWRERPNAEKRSLLKRIFGSSRVL